MRKTWIVAPVLLFVCVSGFAQTPSQAPLPARALAAILGQPAVGGACAAPQNGVVFAAQRPSANEKSLCSATANCQFYGSVSCQSNVSSSSCSAVDNSCPGEPGHVTCDGVTTWCPDCDCTTGTIRQRMCCRCNYTGGCPECSYCAYGFFVPCP